MIEWLKNSKNCHLCLQGKFLVINSKNNLEIGVEGFKMKFPEN